MANQTAPAGGITVSTFGTSTNADLVEKLILSKLAREAQVSGYWQKFVGEIDKYSKVPEACVSRKTDLSKNGGDAMGLPMAMNISPTFVYGDTVLLGNEAAQSLRQLEVKVNQWRAAVQGPSGNANFRIKKLKMLESMSTDILRAIGRERDAEYFRAALEGFSLNLTTTTVSDGLGITKVYHQVCYGVGETYHIPGTAASLDLWLGATGTVGSNDIMDLAALDAVRARMKVGVADSGASNYNRIVPLDLGGNYWTVALMHPDTIYNVQTANSNAWRTGVEYAGVRGNDNPFFTGAVYAYNGFIIHEHRDVPSALGGGDDTVEFQYKDANTNAIKCTLILGKQALCEATGAAPGLVPEDYDFGNQRMLGYKEIMGIARADYKSQDGNAYLTHQGSVVVFSYDSAPTI